MKAKEIRDLIDFISASGLEEVNIETEEFKINIKRSPNMTISATPTSAPVVVPSPAFAPAPVAERSTEAPKAEATPSSEANLITIKSPMIGTFYLAPNPDSPPLIKIGDTVKPGDKVCIIEAMKLFNEIESEVSGKIVKVLVDNATPVEYDQPLFLVDPS